MVDFSKADVTVTLRGDRWTAIVAKLGGNALSEIGRERYNEGIDSLLRQLLESAGVAETAKAPVREREVRSFGGNAVDLLSRKFPIGPANGRR